LLGVRGDAHRLHRGALRGEGQHVDATEGGRVLVLLADRRLEPVQLEQAGVFGNLRASERPAAERSQGLHERYRYRARGAEPRARRDLRGKEEREPRVALEFVKRGLYETKVAVPERQLAPPVAGKDAIVRGADLHLVGTAPVDEDVEVLVDGGRDHESAVPVIVTSQLHTPTTHPPSD